MRALETEAASIGRRGSSRAVDVRLDRPVAAEEPIHREPTA